MTRDQITGMVVTVIVAWVISAAALYVLGKTHQREVDRLENERIVATIPMRVVHDTLMSKPDTITIKKFIPRQVAVVDTVDAWRPSVASVGVDTVYHGIGIRFVYDLPTPMTPLGVIDELELTLPPKWTEIKTVYVPVAVREVQEVLDVQSAALVGLSCSVITLILMLIFG